MTRTSVVGPSTYANIFPLFLVSLYDGDVLVALRGDTDTSDDKKWLSRQDSAAGLWNLKLSKIVCMRVEAALQTTCGNAEYYCKC